jgi:hypothetical protein
LPISHPSIHHHHHFISSFSSSLHFPLCPFLDIPSLAIFPSSSFLHSFIPSFPNSSIFILLLLLLTLLSVFSHSTVLCQVFLLLLTHFCPRSSPGLVIFCLLAAFKCHNLLLIVPSPTHSFIPSSVSFWMGPIRLLIPFPSVATLRLVILPIGSH